ncbi:MAG: hypothetical protein OXF20_07050 [Gammaproteobacteria bacterium]|nr:hypothetical protein [Gammaproteobacteria bacterium]
MDDVGMTGLGYVVLNSKTLVLDTNSRERGDRGQALLESRLGDLVGRAVTSYGDIQKGMEDLASSSFPVKTNKPVPDEDMEQSIRDKHYQRVLNEPLELLGPLTPREAAKTSAENRHEVMAERPGKQRAASWLCEMEVKPATHQDVAGTVDSKANLTLRKPFMLLGRVLPQCFPKLELFFFR